MQIYFLGLVVVLAYWWAAFVFYKKAVENHFDEVLVLDMVVISAFWSFIVSRLFFVLLNIGIFWGHWSRVFLMTAYPGFDRWGFLVGLLLGMTLILRKLKLKFFDWLDIFAISWFSGMAVFWSGLAIEDFKWQFLALTIYNLVIFLWFWRLEKTYRLIDWYRAQRTSARSGLVSGVGLVFLGLGLLLERLSLYGIRWELILEVSLLVIMGVVVVYIRSGRLLKEDISKIKLWTKKPKK